MQKDVYITSNQASREEIIRRILTEENLEITIKKASAKTLRTIPQNAAIHKYCELLAAGYENAGLDMQHVIDEQMSIPWSMDMVKNLQWRPVQIAHGYPHSTTKLETDQVTKVYEALNRHTATNFGIGLPFPSKESMIFKVKL